MTLQEVEILLVEDNQNDVELTMDALRSKNLANHVHVVKDGAEALDFLKNHATENCPRVIFLDLNLPKVDGIDVLREIKKHDRLKLIPVVVMTSSHEERDITETYKLGVNSYIVKPIDFESFTVAVADAGLYWVLLNRSPY